MADIPKIEIFHDRKSINSRPERQKDGFCYASVLGNCSGDITKEHLIPQGILNLFNKKKSKFLSLNSMIVSSGKPATVDPGMYNDFILCKYHNEEAGRLADRETTNFYNSIFNFKKSSKTRKKINLRATPLAKCCLRILCNHLISGGYRIEPNYFPNQEVLKILVNNIYSDNFNFDLFKLLVLDLNEYFALGEPVKYFQNNIQSNINPTEMNDFIFKRTFSTFMHHPEVHNIKVDFDDENQLYQIEPDKSNIVDLKFCSHDRNSGKLCSLNAFFIVFAGIAICIKIGDGKSILDKLSTFNPNKLELPLKRNKIIELDINYE